MSDLKRNLYYNTLLTSAYYVFPLIVYPYVSRVLGVENIGLVGFIDSIATYFILFSMMGISILGVREIARCGNDLSLRKSVFMSLFTLQAIMTLVVLGLMVVITFIVEELRSQLPMMGVAMCKLVFNLFIIEWFYRGLEDFKFITLRTIIVRMAYVAAVFIFVKKSSDTLTYYFLTMLVVFATGGINMFSSRRFLSRSKAEINIKKFLKPFFVLGAYELLVASYSTLNPAFLGFSCNDIQVGYYTTSVKVISILTMLFISFSGVLLPRMSSLAYQGNVLMFKKYFRKALSILVIFSLPVICVVEIFAYDIIMLLSGPGYEGAVTPLRIMIPFLLILGIEQLIIVQTLLPLGHEKIILKVTAFAAFAGIVLNILLVPRYGAVGSACVWGAAETVMLVSAILLSSKKGRLNVN